MVNQKQEPIQSLLAHTPTMNMPRLHPNMHKLFTRFTATVFLIASAVFLAPASAQSNINSLFSKSSSAVSAVVTTEQVRAELLAWAPDGVGAGKQVWLGLQLAHQPEWHTYWKNAGDSGLPTVLDWQLPAGISAGEIAWPTPKKIPIGTLANYGYENNVLLPVPLTVASNFSGNTLDVKLKASWLICRLECIPQEGEFSLSIPVQSSSGISTAVFQNTFKATPKPLPTGSSTAEVTADSITVSLSGLPAGLQGKKLAFFPETTNVIEPAGAWQQAWQGAVWTAQLPISSMRSQSPSNLPVVVALEGKNLEAYQIQLPVKGQWAALAAPAVVSPALEAALKANAAAQPLPASAPPIGLIAALLGALLGGMILNLMPCVFPVLAIKVVGFVNVKSRAERIQDGVAYSVGVVLSFLALGGLLLALRAAGDQLGWGFQLQSPAVVAGMALMFTLIGLNLAGLFEFGNFLPSRVATLQSSNKTANSFLSGVLATAIASPCTAPFMGASLGFALGLPAAQALLIFATIGLGMALPYLAVSAIPGLARAMPRPGAWMQTFRQLMAFPMFATVIWLVWVLGQQSGIDGAGALLALLLLLSLLLWSLNLTGRARKVIASVSLALLAIALWGIGPNVVKHLDTPIAAAAPGARWQNWTPGRVEQLTANGQSVFVDFTAAWCVTCQYNKKTTLANADVLADMDAKKVVLLRADWTRRDPAVTEALAKLGRSGVPVYVIYKAGRAPVLLSEILSVSDVRAELAKL